MEITDWAQRWPLIGRGAELEAFATTLSDRRCRTFVVYGAAGVGKSRLAEECLARAVQVGFEGGRATASMASAAVPLGAIAHLIPPGVDLSDPVKGFVAVAGALAGPNRRRRWMLWIDDLHMLDVTSAVLLRQLMDSGVVRLIATVRTGETVGDAVDTLCHGDEVRRVDLSTLDQQQVETLLGLALRGPVDRRTLLKLHTASGGNVLFLRELVLGALADGTLTRGTDVWDLADGRMLGTPRLAELIAARLAAADPVGRPVLELLALCGPLPLADAEATASLEAVADLEQSGLIRSTQDGKRTIVALTHPLYGEVLRAGLPAMRRRTLLLQQVERTEACGVGRREDPLHIATWRLAATGTADPALLSQAATLARHAHDYAKVIVLLSALPPGSGSTKTRLLEGEAHYELGDTGRAEAALAEAQEQARTEEERFAAVSERIQNLSWGEGKWKEALALSSAAQRQLTDPSMRRTLAVYEGTMQVFAGAPFLGLPLLEDLDKTPDERARLFGLIVRAEGLMLVGRTAEAIEAAEYAYSEHMRANPETAARFPTLALTPLSQALAESGDLTKALSVAHRGLSESVAANAPLPQTWLSYQIGRVNWLEGKTAQAHRWFVEALALAHKHRPALRHLCASGLAASAALLGDTTAADAALKETNTYPRMTRIFAGEERLGEAWLLVAYGQQHQARTVLMEAAQVARSCGQAVSESLLLTDVARLGGAKEVASRLAELAETCDGVLAPARAQFAAALATDDAGMLLAATEKFEQIGTDLLAAEAATSAAAILLRSGYARRATAAKNRASAAVARCQGARTPLLASSEASAQLTSREREVALLAAAGTASKDIAATLHLSVRTVDNHLQHAYTKLGVTTRHELADALGMKTTRIFRPTSTS
ncbi:LuxR C-terminal-related transcriptional regulator [Streptomyces sp. NPDC005574]|uniref:LuxR C-terminal-related transcriptional regulator n=1 Tax=Streptomyces sp. NPDC005574 TaxID=3156891 RepID=UPI0033AF9243